MPKQPAKKEFFKAFLLAFAILGILALSVFNIKNYLAEKDASVLSYSTSFEEENEFWKDFLTENPTYVPGWIEYAKINGKLDNLDEVAKAVEKIKSLDPNYELDLEEYSN